MPDAKSWWRRLGRAVHGVLFPRYWIAVMEHGPVRLVLNSDGREVTADGKTRRVVADEEPIAAFDAVQSVDVVHHLRDEAEHKPEHWSVSLYLGRSQRAFVGRARKKERAVDAAKRLAKIMSKPVRELEVLGPDSHIHSR